MSGWHVKQSRGTVCVVPAEGRGFTLMVDLRQSHDIERLRAVLIQLSRESPSGASGHIIEADSSDDQEILRRLLSEVADDPRRGSVWRKWLARALRGAAERNSAARSSRWSLGLPVALGVLGALVMLQMVLGDGASSAVRSQIPVTHSSGPGMVDSLLEDLSGRLRAEGVDQLQSFAVDWATSGGVTASLRLSHTTSRVKVLGPGASSEDAATERVINAMTAWAGSPAYRGNDGVLSAKLDSARVTAGVRQRLLDEARLHEMGRRQGVVLDLHRADSSGSLEVHARPQPVRQVVRFADDVLAQGSWIRLEIRRADGPPGLVSLTGRIPVAEQR